MVLANFGFARGHIVDDLDSAFVELNFPRFQSDRYGIRLFKTYSARFTYLKIIPSSAFFFFIFIIDVGIT